MAFPTDTIAALATPVGTSAIAVVRVSGARAADLTREIFGVVPLPRTACRGDYCALGGSVLDDVLFTYFAGPNSFTGEDILEISCHGNPFIAQKILEDLFARGSVPADAGDFSKRAFLHGRIDLVQAEAIMDLIHASSDRALVAANRQLRGALTVRLGEMTAGLVRVIAQLEAYIDFPDEDLPTEDRDEVIAELDKVLAATRQLLATSHYGAILRDGVRVVIIGEPNAGKSSLLNCLLGRERALVSPERGTTRDYLEERVGIGGHTFRLIDTAGLNHHPSELEGRGIEKAVEQAQDADLFLWVVDLGEPVFMLPEQWRRRLPLSPHNTILVLNKVDLKAGGEPDSFGDFDCVEVSTLRNSGVDTLRTELERRAERFRIDVGGEQIAINARHAHSLGMGVRALESAAQGMNRKLEKELIVSDLRVSLDCLGEIGGRVDNERVLDELFSSFCIGK